MSQRKQSFLPIHRLTLWYVATLSAVALLVLCGQIVVWFILLSQSNDSANINMAGRQRMLSQKMGMLALALKYTTESTTRRRYDNELQAATQLWERSHMALKSGNQTSSFLDKDREHRQIARLFQGIEPHYQQMRSASMAIVAAERNTTEQTAAPIDPFVNTMLTHEERFLGAMDRIVNSYQRIAEDHVNALKQIESVVTCLALTILILEGIFIFRPLIRDWRHMFRRAIHAEGEVISEKNITKKKAQQDQEIEHILQTHIHVANGDLTARVPFTHDQELWQVGAALNTLLTRYQRAVQAEEEQRSLRQELHQLIVLIQYARSGQPVQWPTSVDPLLGLLLRELRVTFSASSQAH